MEDTDIRAADRARDLQSDPFFSACADYFADLQLRICAAIEEQDSGHSFVADAWERPHGGDGPILGGPILGGHGVTRILEGGGVFERAGIGFSRVYGRFGEAFAARMPVGKGRLFAATGVSLVFHPRSPHVPTVHMNYRRLTRGDGIDEPTGWFGGGAALTPYYLDEDDARRFHGVLRAASERHPDIVEHDRLKAACDAYFHNAHRGEARGIGGTFFDHVTDERADRARTFAFVRDAGDAFIDAYLPIVQRHKGRSFTQRERAWQLLRRGRYVEFNLIHDRGTTFGLKTGGRTESILMSMPPEVRWRYRNEPEPGSPEAALVAVLKTPRDWHLEPATG